MLSFWKTTWNSLVRSRDLIRHSYDIRCYKTISRHNSRLANKLKNWTGTKMSRKVTRSHTKRKWPSQCRIATTQMPKMSCSVRWNPWWCTRVAQSKKLCHRIADIARKQPQRIWTSRTSNSQVIIMALFKSQCLAVRSQVRARGVCQLCRTVTQARSDSKTKTVQAATLKAAALEAKIDTLTNTRKQIRLNKARRCKKEASLVNSQHLPFKRRHRLNMGRSSNGDKVRS